VGPTRQSGIIRAIPGRQAERHYSITGHARDRFRPKAAGIVQKSSSLPCQRPAVIHARWRILRVLIEKIACRGPRGADRAFQSGLGVRNLTRFSRGDSRHHRLDAEDVERSP
jgi:hypothetical protein